jgi:hypothetical protein
MKKFVEQLKRKLNQWNAVLEDLAKASSYAIHR